jgi:hypothetical protein
MVMSYPDVRGLSRFTRALADTRAHPGFLPWQSSTMHALLCAVVVAALPPDASSARARLGTDDTVELKVARLALAWLIERTCTAFLTMEDDPALLAAQLFDELQAPVFPQTRKAQWRLWSAVARWRHATTFATLALHRAAAAALDAVVLDAIAEHRPPDATLEWAALTAITEWELASSP